MRRFALVMTPFIALLGLGVAGCTSQPAPSLPTITTVIQQAPAVLSLQPGQSKVVVTVLVPPTPIVTRTVTVEATPTATAAPQAKKPVHKVAEDPNDFVAPSAVSTKLLGAQSGHFAVAFPILLNPGETGPSVIIDVPSSRLVSYGSFFDDPAGDGIGTPGTFGSYVMLFSDLYPNRAKTMYCKNATITKCSSNDQEMYNLLIYAVKSTTPKAAFSETGYEGDGGCTTITQDPRLLVPVEICNEGNYQSKLIYTPQKVYFLEAIGRFAKQFVESFRFAN
jgi:hypothetical protein